MQFFLWIKAQLRQKKSSQNEVSRKLKKVSNNPINLERLNANTFFIGIKRAILAFTGRTIWEGALTEGVRYLDWIFCLFLQTGCLLHIPSFVRRGSHPLAWCDGREGTNVCPCSKTLQCSSNIFGRIRIQLYYEVNRIKKCYQTIDGCLTTYLQG